ncbi:MAG: signal peptidase I [Aeropyrum sp.]|nr:signal peptidase I [Aeropyrum sp.]MCE4616344.1 signal peptidase I [Aeropyrum sp.]
MGRETLAKYRRVSRLLHAVTLAATLFLVAAYAIAMLAGSGFAVVEGSSMEPLLHSGDLVILSSSGDYGPGDIVVYRKGDRYIIHRIIYEYRGSGGIECYVIKGDNNPIPDTGDPALCGSVRVEGIGYAIGVPETAIVGKAVEWRGIVLKIPYVGILKIVSDEYFS